MLVDWLWRLKNSTKTIINNLSTQLRCSEQNFDSYVRTLNELKNSSDRNVKYNKKNGTYSISNYHIVPGFIKKDSHYVDNLRFLNRTGFCRTSAPELVDFIETRDKNFGVIIYKINDTNGDALLPYLDVSNEIPAEKKKQFLDEQTTLLRSASLYNPAIFESQKNWGVTPDSKNIYIDSWATLTKCQTSDEKKTIIDKLKSFLK